MASKDMGGMRGSGSNARGTGNYGRGGAKPTSGRPAPAQAKRGIGKAGAKPKGPSQAEVKALRETRAFEARMDAQKRTSIKQAIQDDISKETGRAFKYVRPSKTYATRGIGTSRLRRKPVKVIRTAAAKERTARITDNYTTPEVKAYVKKTMNVGPRSARKTPVPVKRIGKG